ncbi:MAG TPA: tRNA (adenosine(37)-N6)-dimethylallyltransferase MiaA [Candidatus Saccharimonadales bacterium]|nr:tRNA (adenosine(37)-N6)-dimethylallyltransferase MiaA [Candidatus Saccharimonadales bacterium]
MESNADNTPVVVIAGETASGKTALAIKLAQQFNGEIICADSRTVYTGMDIGTAKPTAEERAAVPHHLIDVVSPDQPFTAADFKQLALKAIAGIATRGRVPFLVGGTGLYIDAVVYDFDFSMAPDPLERARLQRMSVPELQQEIAQKGYDLPQNSQNPRHLMRIIETDGAVVRAEQRTARPNTLLIGLSIDREQLKMKLTKRVQKMIDEGLVEETQHLIAQYGADAQPLQTTGYKAIRRYLSGELTLEEAKADFVRNDLQLAKRQRTWFKRNKSIHWLSKQEKIEDLITTFLNK